MNKVYQTKFGLKEGNCFEACVSTLTGIPIDKIPNFNENGNWIHNFFVWMENRGNKVIHIKNPLNGNFSVSSRQYNTYAIGKDNTHAFIVDCYTYFTGDDVKQTYFDVIHDPLHKDLKNSDIDLTKMISIFIIEKRN